MLVLDKKIRFLKIFLNLNKKDHPIHPPVTEGDPFDIEIVPNLNCKLTLKDGVMRVLTENGEPFSDFVYPDLKMFVDDYHLMVNLISNGPL